MYKIPAIIFAGGKSSRMGTDKALLPFANYSTLSAYQYTKLKDIFEEVFISTKENKFDFDVPLIKDIHKESSPLIALISIFETLKVDMIFVLSVDAPLVDNKIIEILIKSIDTHPGYGAYVAQSPKGIQPLCAIYHKSILTLAKQYLLNNNHKLRALLKESKTKFIYFEKEEPFTNLNTPQEYQLLFH